LTVDLVLKNLKAYIKGSIRECCIAIEDDKILKLGTETQMPKADITLDLGGLLVLPRLNRRPRPFKGWRQSLQGGLLHRDSCSGCWWLHNATRHAQQCSRNYGR
jgi:hypothetical protein